MPTRKRAEEERVQGQVSEKQKQERNQCLFPGKASRLKEAEEYVSRN